MILVIDVESFELYGQAFAVGCVLADDKYNPIRERLFVCNWRSVCGRQDDWQWIQDNVTSHLERYIQDHLNSPVVDIVNTYNDLIDVFCTYYVSEKSKYQNLLLAAGCCFPVETNFLRDCYKEDAQFRRNAPYPLIDIASIMFAAGLDPTKSYKREKDELPAHNPLMDARQSLRIMRNILNSDNIYTFDTNEGVDFSEK